LHRSTYVVLAVLLAVLLLANVPGQIVRAPSILGNGPHTLPYFMEDDLQHGWPATYLWRLPNYQPNPRGGVFLDWRSLWTLSRDVERWSWASLSLDLLVGLAVLALGATGYEVWRRRRAKLWQFHLSDLLALVVVASAVLGYWKIHADEYRSQQEALAALKVLDEDNWQPGGPTWIALLLGDRRFHFLDRVVSVVLGNTEEPQHLARLRYLKRIIGLGEEGFQYLRHHPQLEALDCSMVMPKGDQWACLRHVPNLKGLTLYDTAVTDADLVHVAGLKKLQHLCLSDNEITDQGLVHLAGLTDLRILSLGGTKITDAGLTHLNGLTSLQELYLSDSVTPAGLDQLTGLTNLERLGLPWNIDGQAILHLRHFRKLQELHVVARDLTDEQLAPLAEMIGLELLTIQGDQFTGQGLKALRPLSRLKQLSLSGANLTDVGLVHLGGLQQLDRLDLTSSRITGQGLAQLKALHGLKHLTLDGTGTTDADLLPLGELATLENLAIHNVPLTDASLSVLARLPRLTALFLDNTEVTDAGLPRLAECQQLEFLTVEGPHITTEGLKQFLQQLPNGRQLGEYREVIVLRGR
jgi:Leucine-rich repeat (LRR) protein